MAWQVKKIERWIVVDPDYRAAIVEDRGSQAKQFQSERHAYEAMHQLSKEPEDD